MEKKFILSQEEWSTKKNDLEQEKRILTEKLALSTRETKTEKVLSTELKNRLELKNQEVKELNEEKDGMKILIEQYTDHIEKSTKTISMSEKKTSDLCQEIERLKMTNKTTILDDFGGLLRSSLAEVKRYEEYHMNFDEICSKPLANLSRETRFVEALSKDISEQVFQVIQGKFESKKEIEIYVEKREQKRIEIIQSIQKLKSTLKQEQGRIASIQHLLIFDNKLDSTKLDELCLMRSKLIEMHKELELRLLRVPNKLQECNHKIDKILQLKAQLEHKDEELDKLDGTIKTQFKKNSTEYKSQMNKLEIQLSKEMDGNKILSSLKLRSRN